MMGDRNDGGPLIGRGEHGGYPAGAVTAKTFTWWADMVASNQDKIIVSCHHHMLKETTVASGDWEGVDGGYHGRFGDGAPVGASYLYWVGGERDSGRFESFLAENPGVVALWIGAHTHATPDDTHGGRSHIERKWGTTFLNTANLSLYHGPKQNMVPKSRILTFTEGSDQLNIRCYLHTSDYALRGWYTPAKRTLPLKRSFTWAASC